MSVFVGQIILHSSLCGYGHIFVCINEVLLTGLHFIRRYELPHRSRHSTFKCFIHSSTLFPAAAPLSPQPHWAKWVYQILKCLSPWVKSYFMSNLGLCRLISITHRCVSVIMVWNCLSLWGTSVARYWCMSVLSLIQVFKSSMLVSLVKTSCNVGPFFILWKLI